MIIFHLGLTYLLLIYYIWNRFVILLFLPQMFGKFLETH